MKLVRFNCGCVGFEPDHDGMAYILKPCDLDVHCSYEYHLNLRDMKKGDEVRSYTDLSEESESFFRVVNDLERLIADGQKFREIKQLLS